MDRKRALKATKSLGLYNELVQLHNEFHIAFEQQFNRSLPFTDELFDRWDRAKKLGFGEGSSVYDSSYIFGDVTVGINTWIGPFTIIDGSGKLQIGDNCTISSGVHIYTHDNVAQTLTAGKASIERKAVKIGECTYIGPNSIVLKGINIGSHCIIGAGSFINKSINSNAIVVGSPGRVIGKTIISGETISMEYFPTK